MEKIDARGLACPQPVILTKKAIEAGAKQIKVLVSGDIARDNVKRMAEKLGCSTSYEKKEDYWQLNVKSGGNICKKVVEKGKSTVIFINSNKIGKGSDELGEVLMKAFFNTLSQSEPWFDKVIFMNGGVELVVEGSPVLDALCCLLDKGVQILACGTCLDYFGLKEKIAVGIISNMYDIIDVFTEADKVITV
ncbi:sulfurtransferase-like selenium metabolism protein YedF [Candidatus Oleimmundimicrobium sp.]|uniref:sulfurtransferase-like selenium metabolism protein YedF n=1 Tax=Candidatus Oleimmundimicrobium sp. TaxID=3060597 RepID=UPI0027281D11|nr:sulfurtransferase-like selenium metabolism protein YedF [Candidatus Oleimmundimicrobium sp.]MDO8886455.1 sulfurtransferase-like selenium metabolism protein YedF [Candidatus Oleimmundimicrobium sp.]